jgi:anti-sigma B factor antagonist
MEDMESSDRVRDAGVLSHASTFLGSFPPSASSGQERRLASSRRVREDGVLAIQAGQQGKDLLIRASGELDIASAATFEDELRRAIDSDACTVILDVEGLTFIDSTGLRAFLKAAEMSRSTGRSLIVRASKEFRRLVEVSGVEETFQLDRSTGL